MAPSSTSTLKRKPTNASPNYVADARISSHKRRVSVTGLSMQPDSKLLTLPHELQQQILSHVFEDGHLSYFRPSRQRTFQANLQANYHFLMASKLCYYRWLSLYYSKLQVDIHRRGGSVFKVLKLLPRSLRHNVQHLRLDKDHHLIRKESHFYRFPALRLLECSLHPIDLGERSIDLNDREGVWQRIKERNYWNSWAHLQEESLKVERKHRYSISFEITWPVDGIPGGYDFMPCTYEVSSCTFVTYPERKHRSFFIAGRQHFSNP